MRFPLKEMRIGTPEEIVQKVYAFYHVKTYLDRDSVPVWGTAYAYGEVALGCDWRLKDYPMALHELGHIFVASKQELRQLNYGLGSHPQAIEEAGDFEPTMPWYAAEEIEMAASDQHIWMVRKLFGDEPAEMVSEELIMNFEDHLQTSRHYRWPGSNRFFK